MTTTPDVDPVFAASYRHAIHRTGRDVTIVRLQGYAPNVVRFTATVKANIQSFSSASGEAYSGPGAIAEGMRRVILLVDDLAEKAFPLPLVDGDKMEVNGRQLDILDIDDETRRLAGAIQFDVKGVA